MASAFNLLTAGGARFDKSRFKNDFELFEAKKSSKGKAKASEPVTSGDTLPPSLNLFHDPQHPAHPHKRPRSLSVSSSASSSSSSSSSHPAPALPSQKITLSGPDPLPKSLHTNLPSLIHHPAHVLPSAAAQPLLTSLDRAGIKSLWGVQCAVGGCLLEGKDVLCVAPTGSGKTLAYVLPTLVALRDPARSLRAEGTSKGIRAVILVPTRDLASQIEGVVKAVIGGRKWRVVVLKKSTEKAVCESSPGSGAQTGQKEDGVMDADDYEDEESEEEEGDAKVGDKKPLGVDILIATPERLHHLVESQQLSLANTRHLILDESDRLLSPDFMPQLTPIVDACSHPALQKCLLSATMPAGAEELGRKWLRDGGVRVVVGLKDAAATTIAQSLLYTSTEPGKLLALRNLLASGELPYPSLIFVQSIERAEQLLKELLMEGVRAEAVHSGKTQGKRDLAVERFRKGETWVLVGTEVLGRGMDFRGVKVVLNYDFPQTLQSYIHRIGRTARAGLPGRAITFFSNEDAPFLRPIATALKQSGCDVPAYMLDMARPGKRRKREVAKKPVERKEVGMGGRDVGREEGRKSGEMKRGSKRRAEREGKGEADEGRVPSAGQGGGGKEGSGQKEEGAGGEGKGKKRRKVKSGKNVA